MVSTSFCFFFNDIDNSSGLHVVSNIFLNIGQNRVKYAILDKRYNEVCRLSSFHFTLGL